MLTSNRTRSRFGWRLAAVALVCALLLAVTAPVFAISYGVLDGNAHPFVGSIVVSIPGEGLFQWCSGTLIAARVFLTASHCTAPLDNFVVNNPGAEVLVTFDPTINESATFYTGTWHTNPNYNNFQGQFGRSNPGDVAVIVLDHAPGITPAQLPPADLLDQLQATGVLRNTLFTAVGYGTVRDTNRGGFAGILDNLDRRRVDQEFVSLTPNWLTLSMNLSTGNGGTCYGDSGGPHFIHLNGHETTIVAAVTVTGDAVCKATDVDYRMDTAAARSFLSHYVTLP